MWACNEGHYEVAKLLIENGADVNAKSTKARRAFILRIFYNNDNIPFLVTE